MKQLIPFLAATVASLILTSLAGGQTTQPKPIYGKIVSVDTTTGKIVITVGTDTSRQVTVATDANTKVLISDKAGKLADLKVGMSVRIVPATGTATEIRAFSPKPAPTPPPASQPSCVYGKVVSVDATAGKLVITVIPDNTRQVTIATDTATKVIVEDKPGTLANVKAGMTVRVAPATGTATEIRAFSPKPAPTPPPAQPKPIYGKVVSVDATAGKLVVAAGTDNTQVTVTTDANTKVLIGDKADTLANIKAGMTVRIVPATGTATEIRVFTPK